MEFRASVNHRVKVKLTAHGRAILKQRYDHLNKMIARRTGGAGDRFTPTYADEDGYYSEQLWSLMDTFGEHVGLGKEPPFEMDMIFKGEPLEPITVLTDYRTVDRIEDLSEEEKAERCIKEIEAAVDKYGFRLGWDKYKEQIELESRKPNSNKTYPIEWRE